MSFNKEFEDSKKNISVMILGSYDLGKFEYLQKLKEHLKDNGILNVFLAIEKDEENIQEDSDLKDNLLTKIENLMETSDFNFFVLFEEIKRDDSNPPKTSNCNNSVLIELTAFVKSSEYKKRSKRTMVFIPNTLEISMLTGLIDQNKLILFRYLYIEEIYKKAQNFIETDLIYQIIG